MDSLSSAPGNRNSSRLLSAAFAIATSVSGAVNAATTPNFTEEPAGSPKVVNAASAQKAILDMLPADHKSRPGIAASIKALEDGGNIQELTNLFIWAKTIADSPSAPPAAKEKAKEILLILTPVEPTKTEQKEAEEIVISRKKGDLFEDFKPGKRRGELIQDWAINSEGVMQLKYEVNKEGILHISGSCPGQEGKVFLVPKGKFADVRTKKGSLTVGFLGWKEPTNMAFAQVRIKNGNRDERLNISKETGLAYTELSRGEDNKNTLICLVFKNGDFSAKLSSPTMFIDDSSVVADINKKQ